MGEVVTGRLSDLGASTDEVDWDSRKRSDGNWQVQLAYTIGGRMYLAEWVYDARSRHVTPADDEAIRLCLDESQWPGPRPASRLAVTATVTPISARAAAAHQPPHPSEQRGPVSRARPAPAVSPAAAAAPAAGPGVAQAPAGHAAQQAGRGGRDSGETPASPSPAAADEPARPARPARRASGGRSRRSSVPSWDEIMFGNSRQPE